MRKIGQMRRLFQIACLVLLSSVLSAGANSHHRQNFYLSPKSAFSFSIPSEVRTTHFEQAEELGQIGSLIFQKNPIQPENSYFKLTYPAYSTKTKKRFYLAPQFPTLWLNTLISETVNSIIYDAWDFERDEEVIIKVLGANYTDEDKSDFRFEAEVLQKFDHPNIVKAHKLSDSKNGVSYIMEKINGHHLDYFLSNKTPLSFEEIFAIGIQTAEALEYIHQNEVIHRDIKTRNLIWNQVEKKLTLIDFGIAIKKGENPYPDQIRGTISYLSPEQIKPKEKITEKTDIYSLGVVLYELCTKKLPYNGEIHPNLTPEIFDKLSEEDQIELVMVQISRPELHKARKPVRALNPCTPPGLEKIINKAMSFKPHNRHQTATALKEALIQARDKLFGRVFVEASSQEINISL